MGAEVRSGRDPDLNGEVSPGGGAAQCAQNVSGMSGVLLGSSLPLSPQGRAQISPTLPDLWPAPSHISLSSPTVVWPWVVTALSGIDTGHGEMWKGLSEDWLLLTCQMGTNQIPGKERISACNREYL